MITTNYWTVSYGTNCRIGFSCRECKQVIPMGAPIAVRDGRKMRLFYHKDCFSEDSDPRTQTNSSFKSDKFKSSFQAVAPVQKGRGKWSVSSYGYDPAPLQISKTLKIANVKPKVITK